MSHTALELLDSLPAGTVIIHTDEDTGVLWAWNGGCQVGIVDAESGKTVDVFNWMEAPNNIVDALAKASDRAERLREEERENV